MTVEFTRTGPSNTSPDWESPAPRVQQPQASPPAVENPATTRPLPRAGFRQPTLWTTEKPAETQWGNWVDQAMALYMAEDSWPLDQWLEEANAHDPSGRMAELTRAIVLPTHPHHEPILQESEPDEDTEPAAYAQHTGLVKRALNRLAHYLGIPKDTLRLAGSHVITLCSIRQWQAPVGDLITALTTKRELKGFFYWDEVLPLAERVDKWGRLFKLMGALRKNPDLLCKTDILQISAEKLACRPDELLELATLCRDSSREKKRPEPQAPQPEDQVRLTIAEALAQKALQELEAGAPPPQYKHWQGTAANAEAAAAARARKQEEQTAKANLSKLKKPRKPGKSAPSRHRAPKPSYPTRMAAVIHHKLITPTTREQVRGFLKDLGWDDVVESFFSGKALPKHLRDVQKLSNHLVFKQNHLINAWAWDKVAEMAGKYPLDPVLSPEEKTLALHLRYVLWRVYDGNMRPLVGKHYDNPLYIFLTTGKLPVNSHNADFDTFYDSLQKCLAHKCTWKGDKVRLMIREARLAHFARLKTQLLDWAKDHPIDCTQPEPLQRLLGLTRQAIAMEFGIQYSRALPQFNGALHHFILEGRIPPGNHPRLSLKEFYGQIEGLITRAKLLEPMELASLIEEVVLADRKIQDQWVDLEEMTPEYVRPVVSFLRTQVIHRFRGVIPQAGTDGISELSPLRDMLITGRFKVGNNGSLSLAKLRDQYVQLTAGTDTEKEAQARQVFEGAIITHLQWQHCCPPTQAETDLLLWARQGALKNYAGVLPVDRFSHETWITRYLAEGRIPKRHQVNFNVGEFFDELVMVAASGEKPDALQTLFENAIFSTNGWGAVSTGEKTRSAVQKLLFRLRRQVAKNDGGVISFNGTRGIPRRSPFHGFLDGTENLPLRNFGKLTLKEFYWDLMFSRLTENGGLTAGEARLTIRNAIFQSRGWNKPSENPADVGKLLQTLRVIVADSYGGLVPVCAKTPEGQYILGKESGLAALIENGTWPTEPRFRRDLLVSARRFLAVHKAKTRDVESMMADVQENIRPRQKNHGGAHSIAAKTVARAPKAATALSTPMTLAPPTPSTHWRRGLWGPQAAIQKIHLPTGIKLPASFSKNVALSAKIPGRV